MLFANIVINYEFENRTYKPNTICRNINKLLAESKEKVGRNQQKVNYCSAISRQFTKCSCPCRADRHNP